MAPKGISSHFKCIFKKPVLLKNVLDEIGKIINFIKVCPFIFLLKFVTPFWVTKWKVHMKHSVQFSSVTQLCPTLCDPMDCSYARLPCPLTTPGAYPNLCLLSWWCHPTISSSVIPFSSCLQSFLASGSFPVSQLFTSGGQSIGASASASVLQMNIQDWFPLGWTGWISLQSKGLSRVFSWEKKASRYKSINISVLSFLYSPALTSIYDYWNNQSFD